MKAFAGIKLESLEFDNLSAWNSRCVQKKLLYNYLDQVKFLEANQELDDEQKVYLREILDAEGASASYGYRVVKHLINYIKINITPALSYTQEVALAIRFLPENSTNPNPTKDDLVVKLVKDTIGNYNYNLRNIKQMEVKVWGCKDQLNYKGDWADSVFGITTAIERKNLAMAYELLDKIKNLSAPNPRLSKSDLPFIYSLQLVYYIDVIEFLYDNLSRALIDVFSAVEKEYRATLKALQDLPEFDTAPTRNKYNFAMLFSDCMHTKQAYTPIVRPSKLSRIFPE